jgi:hypothetical protein
MAICLVSICLDYVQRCALGSPSPTTVAVLGATVRPSSLHRLPPPPPPLPSRFLLSPAKWMGTLRRSRPIRLLASQTSPRDRKTPRSELQASPQRPHHRRRTLPWIRPLQRFICLAPGGEQQTPSSTRIHWAASRSGDPVDPCEDAAVGRLRTPGRGANPRGSVVVARQFVVCGTDVNAKYSNRRQIDAHQICFVRATTSKVRPFLSSQFFMSDSIRDQKNSVGLTVAFTCPCT